MRWEIQSLASGNFKLNLLISVILGLPLVTVLQMVNAVFAYIPDHEPALGSPHFPNELEWTSGIEIAENADLLFHDGQYTDEEYKSKIGWGHSSVNDAIAFGGECKVKKMAIFHHDPLNSDDRLEEIYEEAITQTKPSYPVILCKEGEEFELG